jgi:hypothetical protein
MRLPSKINSSTSLGEFVNNNNEDDELIQV